MGPTEAGAREAEVPAEGGEAPAGGAPAGKEGASPAKDAPAQDPPAKDAPAKDAPARDPPAKDAPAKDAPARDPPAQDAPAKDAPEKKPAAAPPAKAGPEAPEFEGGIAGRIAGRFGDRAEVVSVRENRIAVRASRDDVREVAEFVRDELNFDHAESVSGVDYPEDGEIEVVYHLGSYLDPSLSSQVLALSTRAPREGDPDPGRDSTRLPSLRDVFYSVEFHERECFEMLGVYFEGHPDNRRLLLPEDWADLPPLRRDFAIKGR